MGSNWDLYWQSTNSLGTFGEQEGNIGLPKELITYWQETFVEINNVCNLKKISMLDVGTGNGVLPYLALTNCPKFSKVIGVDLAAIDPMNTILDKDILKVLATVEFIGSTNIESFNVSENSLDIVTSNFAIEYANLPRALSSVVKGLKTGGKFYGVLHAVNSVSFNDSNTCLEVLQLLKEKYLLLDMLEAFILESTPQASDDREKLFQKLMAIKQQINPKHYSWFMEIAKHIAAICIEHKNGLSIRCKQSYYEFKKHIDSLEQRLQEQVKASYRKNTIADVIQGAGIDNYSINKLLTNDGLVAWAVNFEK